MIISHQWLSEYVDLAPHSMPPARVAEVLTNLGLEVEHIEDMATTFNRFVVGFVVDKQPHPNADKLSVCTVNVGEPEHRTIVCGAKNVDVNQYVAVALDGAVIPGADFTIGKRKLRGVESNGMICSQAELGLGDESDGIWVLEADNNNIGMSLAEFLGKTDVLYHVFNTPNRADANSHIGVARELCAYLSVELNTHLPPPTLPEPKNNVHTNNALIVGEISGEGAPRYALRKISGVNVTSSPQWLQDRLTAVGLRPRNILVDVTNYVNMECGQPLHAFDASKLSNPIEVHTVEPQTFVTLDGKERQLDDSMLMICDGQQPIAIAGVMGGNNSEIDESTTDVILESAYFNPQSIRRTAKKLSLVTDASYRFERGVDPENVMKALDRATDLILEYAGGSVVGEVDHYPSPLPNPAVHVRFEKMRAINGINVTNQTMCSMFEALGCRITEKTDSACEVVPPTWRVDLGAEIDFAEEVMRLYGINNIAASSTATITLSEHGLHESVQAAGSSERLKRREEIRQLLRGRGYADCVTSVLTSPEIASFGGEDVVLLQNALGKEFSAMRTSLLAGLMGVASRNLRHGADAVRIFDVGNTFHSHSTSELGVEQREHLCVLVCGRRQQHWSLSNRTLDVYDLFSDLSVLGSVSVAPQVDRPADSHMGLWTQNVVDVIVNETVVGTAGQVHPNLAKLYDVDVPVFAAEIDVRLIPLKKTTYQPIAQFPAVQRDLAIIVNEEVLAGTIIDVVKSVAPKEWEGATVFDVFRDTEHVGANKKSVAIAITFRSNERTLVDSEVDAWIQAMITAVHQQLAAQVRGAAETTEGRA